MIAIEKRFPINMFCMTKAYDYATKSIIFFIGGTILKCKMLQKIFIQDHLIALKTEIARAKF